MDVLIDLDTASPPPVRRPPRPRLPRSAPRLLLVAGVALTLALPASVAPHPPPLTRLFTVPFTAEPLFAVGDDAAFVADRNTLTAYALASGRPLWQAPQSAAYQRLTVVGPAGVLVVTLDDGAVVALDQASGAALWRRERLSIRGAVGGNLLALEYGQQGESRRVYLVDARTGETSTPHEVAPGAVLLTNAAPLGAASAVVVTGVVPNALDVDVFSLVSGATLVSGDLVQRQPELRRPLYDAVVSLIGHLIVVAADRPDRTSVAYAFDTRTLAPLWSAELPASVLEAVDCAGEICLTGGDVGTAALDPATGALLGFAGWQRVTPVAPGLLIGQTTSASAVLLGSDLGRRLDLDVWRLVALQPYPLLILPGAHPFDVYVAALDPARVGRPGGPLLHLGALHVGPVGTCQASAGYLVCYAFNSGIVAFTLPR